MRQNVTNKSRERSRGASDIRLETHNGGKHLAYYECEWNIEFGLESFNSVGGGDPTSLVILGDQLLLLLVIYTIVIQTHHGYSLLVL